MKLVKIIAVTAIATTLTVQAAQAKSERKIFEEQLIHMKEQQIFML